MTKDDSKKKLIRNPSISPHFILNDDFKPFNEYYNIFGRLNWDESLKSYGQSMYTNIPKILLENKPGYRQFEHAWALASWTVHDYFHGAFSEKKLDESGNMMETPNLKKVVIDDKNIVEVTKVLKEVAKSFGASLIGITKYDNRWIYTNDRQNNPIIIPKWVTNVIVMAIEMEPEAFGTSPSYIHGYANGFGYSQMAILVSSLAEYIRLLGYNAKSSGNDTGVSIPMAIDAGLGQLGRHGLLITKKYGPRVRLCKIFTDMPLIHDKPIDFGITDYCRKCQKCAEACEVDAISFESEPSFDIACKSNNKGIYRWAVNGDKCYEFWVENGGECSTCITVCPFNIQANGQENVDPSDYWIKRIK
ncbi:MAG: reductive dehalogenase [Asgard group archaeon]|nr:reductive dehalogenase [Asgard group archaeon]